MTQPDGPTSLYRYFGDNEKLLYVGITSSMHSRFIDHSKGAKWHRLVRNVSVEHFEKRSEALAAEKKAIKEEGPQFNVAHSPMGARGSFRYEKYRSSVSAVVDRAPPLTPEQVARLQALFSGVKDRVDEAFSDWT